MYHYHLMDWEMQPEELKAQFMAVQLPESIGRHVVVTPKPANPIAPFAA
jgi:hypothetical protein